MRTTIIVAIGALLLAGLVPGAAADDHWTRDNPRETLVCESRTTLYGSAALEPCTVSGEVETGFLMRVISYKGNAGPVQLDAKGPHGAHVYFTCAFGLETSACGPPVFTGTPYQGTWSFTADPTVVGVYASGHMRLEVDVW